MQSSVAEAELSSVLLRSPRVVRVLRAVRQLRLSDGYVAAGFVRDTYFGDRHALERTEPQQDVDVVFFDPALPQSADHQLGEALASALPGVRWEVTNQAHVHTWYEHYCGAKIVPLTSTVDGMAMWPEVATCVGARLRDDDALEVAAPHGLADLLAMRWRPNAHCPDRGAFARRLAEKDIRRRWPLVEVISVEERGGPERDGALRVIDDHG
jgi:hypothetical protein